MSSSLSNVGRSQIADTDTEPCTSQVSSELGIERKIGRLRLEYTRLTLNGLLVGVVDARETG